MPNLFVTAPRQSTRGASATKVICSARHFFHCNYVLAWMAPPQKCCFNVPGTTFNNYPSHHYCIMTMWFLTPCLWQHSLSKEFVHLLWGLHLSSKCAALRILCWGIMHSDTLWFCHHLPSLVSPVCLHGVRKHKANPSLVSQVNGLSWRHW